MRAQVSGFLCANASRNTLPMVLEIPHEKWKSTLAFQYMVATTEFQNQARTWGWGFSTIPAPSIPLQSDMMLKDMAQRMLGGVEIELNDSRYWTQDERGKITSAPFLPVTKVLFTSKSNDGNSSAYDFANGNTTEGMVANMVQVPTMGAVPTGPGPIAYATPTTPDLNSPGITYWGVARGFPRKHILQSSAVLTVGTFVDSVSSAFPAFL